MHKLISICIFTYNRAKYLPSTLNSILSQTNRECEIIIVDDGSTDSTSEVLSKYRGITYHFQNNLGAPAARNKCIDLSNGDFILWVGSDDILFPGIIHTYIESIKNNPDCNIFYGNYVQFGNKNAKRPFADFRNRNVFIGSYLVNGNKIPDGGSLIRKDLYELSGSYSDEFKRCNDYEFWTRAIKHARFFHTNATSYGWRVHNDNMTYCNPDHSFECKTINNLIELYPRDQLFPQFDWKNVRLAEAKTQLLLGQVFLSWGDYSRGLQHIEASLKVRETPKAYQILSRVLELANNDRYLVFRKKAESIKLSGSEGSDFCAEIQGKPHFMPYNPTELPPQHFELFPGFAPILPVSNADSAVLHQALRQESSIPKGRKVSSTTSKMKLLFVCHNFPPYNTAGAQLFAIYLAKELRNRGHSLSFFYPVDVSRRTTGDNSAPYALSASEYEQFQTFELNVPDDAPSLMSNPQYMFSNEMVEQKFAQLLHQEGFQIVHFHLLYRLSARLPAIARSQHIPTVATLHDYWLLCAMGHLIDTLGRECSGPDSPEKCACCLNGWAGKPQRELIDFFAVRQQTIQTGYMAIDRRYSPSERLARTHAQFGFDKPETLPLGWPSIVCRECSSPKHTRITLGFIGQIVYRKGLDILVDAIASLPQAMQSALELHIHGTINQPQYFDSIMKKARHISGIQYFGPYDHAELGRILPTFDVAVIPSRQENYPLTVLESLSAHVPVIAADVGGIREMFRNKVEGFLFPREDGDRLAKIIQMILLDPSLLATMRDKIKPIKTIRRNAEEYEDIYKGLLLEDIGDRA